MDYYRFSLLSNSFITFHYRYCVFNYFINFKLIMGRTSRRSDSTKSEKSEKSERSDKSDYVKEKRVSFVKTQLIHEKLTNHLMNKLLIENFLMFWFNFIGQ